MQEKGFDFLDFLFVCESVLRLAGGEGGNKKEREREETKWSSWIEPRREGIQPQLPSRQRTVNKLPTELACNLLVVGVLSR